jgi:potassium/sodium efflux P-type ATPase
LEPARPVPRWRRFLTHFADPLVYLLLAAVAVSLVVWVVEGVDGVPFEALVILVIVVANAVLGYVQESRAEHAVAALQEMASTHVVVLRDGDELRVPTRDVVPGDVLLLSEGDAVSADGRLFEVATLMVSEASLTGESEPVGKEVAPLDEPSTLGDRVNMVFSGTAVTRGRGRAVVTATGMSTEMGRIARLLDTTEDSRTPLQGEIDAVGRVLGIAVVVISAVVVTTILLGADIREASDLVAVMLVGVSLAVAAVPESLPAVLSLVLALGVQRMAARNAIVKRLSSVETLGSASVVGSDKTGTLTRSEMVLVEVVTPSGEVEVTGSGYAPEGGLLVGQEPLLGGVLYDEVVRVLIGGGLANDAELRREDGEWVVHGDPTEGALLVAGRKLGLTDPRHTRLRRVGEIPFSAERKLMTTLEENADRGGAVDVVTKGAPDVLLTRCVAELVAGEPRPLSTPRRAEILAGIDRLAGQALRTLAVAYRPLPNGTPPVADLDALENEMIYLGTVGIIDPPRPEARTAVEDALAARIRVLMITGDHPLTADRIARDLGIAEHEGGVVTGADIQAMDDNQLREAVGESTVFARVAPEHKLRIVEALREEGHIVAMTGDGVNDAPALKAADIGVAMGVAGTAVAKEAADMVLADDNFATIIAAVREGRGIFANIRRFLRFLLSSNAGEVLTMFLGVVLTGVIGLDEAGGAVAVPLLATQILWVNLLTDTAPALAMGVEPPPGDVMHRPPRRLGDRVIDRRMWVRIAWVGLVMAIASLAALDLGLPGGMLPGSGTIEEARTMAFTTLVLAQLFNCFNARSDRASAARGLFTNRWLWGAVGLSLLLQAAVVHVPWLNRAFDTVPLSAQQWLTCTALASSVLWAVELTKLVGRRLASGGAPN